MHALRHLEVVEPESQCPTLPASPPLVILVPALGVAPAYYRPLVEAMECKLDAEVSVVPLPRARTLRERWLPAARTLGFATLVSAISEEARRCRQAHPGRRLFLLGHSIGGQAGLLAAAADASVLDGVALVACGTPYWRAWPQAEQRRARLAIYLVDVASACLPWYPGRLIGFGGDQPRALMRDWLVTARTGSYAGIAGGAVLESKLRELRLPVLALRIEGDAYAPASAVDYLLHKCPRASVTRALASSETLASMKPDRRHVAWARDPDAVLPHLRRWMVDKALLAQPLKTQI